ncbi:MAG: urease accessory protein, partial [Flavobacteriales bacterium]
ADLGVMDRDAKRMRKGRPFVFSNLKDGTGVETIIQYVQEAGLLA